MAPSRPGSPRTKPGVPRFGLARVLSKAGICSRSQAEQAIRAGRVKVDGRIVLDPQQPVDPQRQRLSFDGAVVGEVERVYIALNKPRGIVVSAADERGRGTVYDLLAAAGLPWLGPVGRLDKASEGLLLLTNDSRWAAGLTESARHVDKTYHVQIDALPDADLLRRLAEGVVDNGEMLRVRQIKLLRSGQKNAWLEVVLDEGRNRHIRRLLEAHRVSVLRLVRVAVGELALGDLGKGQWRHLGADEVAALRR